MQPFFRRSLRQAAFFLLIAFAPEAEAQSALPQPPPAVQAAPQPTETRPVRAQFDALKLELDQREAALKRPNLSDDELQSLRQGIDPVVETIRGLVDELTPRLDAAKARLEQLGPKPEEGAPPEGADVAQERTERERAAAEFDEAQRLGRALLVQGQQLAAQVSDRRRAGFARALFQQNASLLDPGLWMRVAQAMPREMRVLRAVLGEWTDRIGREAHLGTAVLVALAFAAAVLLYWARRRFAPRLVTRDPSVSETGRRRRVLAAVGALALGTLPAAAASLIVFLALDATGLVPPRLRPVVVALLAGIAFVVLVRSLADAVLAPGRDAWRLTQASDAAARRVVSFATALAAVLTVGNVVETVNQAIAAALPITVATRGLFALAAAAILAELLRRFGRDTVQDEACLGPYVPTEPGVAGPFRTIGWLAAGIVVASLITGYIAFASFLVDQLVWVAILLTLLFLAIAAVEETIAGALRGETRLATTLQANIGLRRRSLQQIAVLVDGVARVVLILAAALLALAPWGVDSADVFSSLRAAFFGFRVGDVTVSLSTLVVALVVFGLGFAATRLVQRWLDHSFLPATDLDAGLRNSIRTAFGYLGLFVSAALALSYLGLGLDKIAIVAGALSVGIGFGLQSIVNNFVSGLILLWERPIRVGDLVVVGDGEGFVRRIDVRATEIETFDRSTVIIPNSNLISGVVRNRVRSDRTGRVIISVNVLRSQDPAHAAELLMGCARDHPDVLRDPAPKVFFKKIGDTFLEFDLVCFVLDVEHQARVQSELNFSVFACLTQGGVVPPLGPPALNVLGLGPVEAALEHIAGAIGGAERDRGGGSRPKPGGGDTIQDRRPGE